MTPDCSLAHFWREMLNRDAACKVILSRGWLRQTPASFQRAVVDRCRLEKYPANTPVYAVGDEPGGLFGIVSGCLSISVSPQQEGPYTAHLALPGAWFGEASVFTRRPRMAGLTATRETTLMHLPLCAIDDIVKGDPGAWRYFGLVMLDHLERAIGGSADLMIRNHTARVVSVLLRLGDCRYASPQDDLPVEIDIGHEDLAHMANVSRTTAGAVLRELEAGGQLTLAYRRIIILAPDVLRRELGD
jgi:CRP/FNR family transcriptional regulator, cyclic AMP receptor protein